MTFGTTLVFKLELCQIYNFRGGERGDRKYQNGVNKEAAISGKCRV